MESGSPKFNDPNDKIADLPMRDIERALRITGGDATLANQIFELMVQDLPSQLEKFLRLQQEENWGELKRSVHRLRGSVTYCAVPALEHNLSVLETAAAGKPRDIERHIQALESLVQRLVEASTD
jgi:two-component system sensor histidine kinase BarA